MKINGQTVNGKKFAYEGCHKMYIIEDDQDEAEAIKFKYDIFPIEQLEKTYIKSCELKFISNWKLTKRYVRQYEEAQFEY